jgi:hypothetical protein
LTLRALLALCFLLPWGAWHNQASAHEVRPGYLEIRESAGEVYDILWKVPAKGDYRLGLYVRLPANCEGEATSGNFVGGAFIERWRARCPGGLVGSTIEIDGLPGTRTDVLVRLQRADGTTQTERLSPDRSAFAVVAAPGAAQVFQTYVLLGIEHILGGVDHLLFVLILLFLVGNWRVLVATITAFTVAHSITLALATLGYLYVPQAPVEAAIALSVMFVAAEVLQGARGRPGLAVKAPWLVAFVFGLLHGLGFAGALREVGLPQHEIPLALLCFNIGVEAGQLLFIGATMLALSLATRVLARREPGQRGPWQAEAMIRTPVAYVVGSIAAFWVVQRVAAFWA